MSIADRLPLSPPSTSSRRKSTLLSSSVKGTSTPDSPASFPGSSNAGSRKRVGFSSGANIHKPMSSSQPLSSVDRPPFASSEAQPSLRSILKPGPVLEKTVHLTDGSQDLKRTPSEMMDSFLEQLSQDDRTLSVDAYQTLANIIKNYDEIPEEDVLKAKINAFIKYIKRDLLRKPSPEEPSIADTNLMTQALRLLTIFVWNKNYAPLLSDETRTFILDRSIQVLAEHTASKNVVVFYLHLLAAQNFRQILITGHRVARLLEALKTLTEHYKGNSVISERLLVYQKLFDQERPTMKAKANLWIQELLTGTTSSLKDIRTKAIELGLKACLAFPPSSSISTVVRSTLARELSPGKTFSSSMCRKLEKMITVKEEGAQVPQIWAIVLRLCNNLDDRGRNGWGPHCDEWSQFKDWMNVIQKCFNCSDPVISSKAYQAWNHFIHIAQPHLASSKLLQILAKPMTIRLERHGGDAPSKSSRVAASSSYCALLYYAFRPAATHDQYTRVWNEYIVQVMKSSFFEKSTANTDIACRIFMGLFWNSGKGAKIWNENRGHESGAVEPEELPTIDCKWLRLKAKQILDVFRVLMRYSSWGGSGQSDRAFIAVAWTHFLKALREASRKEIKPSSETVEAMVHVTSFLGRLHDQLPSTGEGELLTKPHAPNAAQIRQLTVTAVTVLGHDLILAGLDKGPGLCKALVVFDAIDPTLSGALAKFQDTGVEKSAPGGLQPQIAMGEHDLLSNVSPDCDLHANSKHRSPSPTERLAVAEQSPELGSQHFQNMAIDQRFSVRPSPHAAVSRPRSRHDDSQAQFVPIESSPLLPGEPESQFLTDHQKEVRDRQRSEPAVVFADLRSSPRPHARSVAHSDCEFARKVASQAERPATPTLPANDDQGEPEIMASPTPRARHIANQIMDIEVPSSPPSMMGNNGRHEIDYSPSNAALADVKDRIDFAIEQLEEPEEHSAMDLDGPEAAEVVSAQNEPIVEKASLGANAEIEMVKPHLDEPNKVPQTHVVESNPRQLQGASSPSLRPITINITSDSTAPEVNHENMESSPSQRVRTDSDEIDMLSASQLSHDLDQHIYQNISDGADTGQSEQQGDDQEATLTKQRSRKRKSNNQKFTTGKRRKSLQASSQRSPPSIEADSSVYDTPGELLDCIEVSPLQAGQAIASTGPSESTASPRRRPGRPRKRPLKGTALPRRQHSQTSRIEVIVETSQIKAETMEESGGVDFALPVNGECDQDLNHDIEIQEVATTMQTDSAESLSTEHASERANNESTSISIMASLQDVLDRLKSASPTNIDLRSVDDLCFQIRFQAQVIAQQK